MAEPGAVGAGRRVVLGVGGGIAAYKAASLLRRFTESGFDVTVVPTEAALRFVGEPTWSALSGHDVTSEVWDSVQDVRHVMLGQRADLVVVAPATADLLARAAHGLADDLLTNVLLTASCPVVMAPAMHTEMWEHAATTANVATLRSRGVHVIEPASGRLTGTDTGKGRMPEPEDIYEASLAVLNGQGAFDAARPLEGLRVVVSAGGTREALDPVRFLGNRSSGKQGYALAEIAARRGAEVTLVSANVSLPVPAGVRVVPVESAREMKTAVFAEALGLTWADGDASGGSGEPRVATDVVIMAAAVADFRPRTVAGSKMKKTHDATRSQEEQDAPVIELVRNPDILADLVAARNAAGLAAPFIVGFAAETGDDEGDVLHHARAKFARKGVDLLVANEVGADVTFGKDSSTVYLLTTPDTATDPRLVGPANKSDISEAIWDEIGSRVGRS
ncbi:MAG: bifunctional phosphopantothenoylcysteine decarboxylase/phosphopantothenate--cysteine ligase CoaBC [Dermatophilus congolensis]|nr:bifunctional phosphopantothenoylcysteine decarboxylase/phosphopantothenate--cysteine ligase CoaBC [Dermatophilus congolensis]